LAAAIKQGVNVEPRLVKGANGIFDVAVDGKLVFSKYRDGRFPGESEIVDSIRKSGTGP
jgi:selT/selW/selH-like putative selenoprotein